MGANETSQLYAANQVIKEFSLKVLADLGDIQM